MSGVGFDGDRFDQNLDVAIETSSIFIGVARARLMFTAPDDFQTLRDDALVRKIILHRQHSLFGQALVVSIAADVVGVADLLRLFFDDNPSIMAPVSVRVIERRFPYSSVAQPATLRTKMALKPITLGLENGMYPPDFRFL